MLLYKYLNCSTASSSNVMLSHYVLICSLTLLICLLMLTENVIAINHYPTTFESRISNEYDICKNLFNDQQCAYIQSVFQMFINKFEWHIEEEKLLFEKERSTFLRQIRQLEQAVKLLKTKFRQTKHKQTSNNNKQATKNKSIAQSTILPHLLTNADPSYFQHNNDHNLIRNMNMQVKIKVLQA